MCGVGGGSKWDGKAGEEKNETNYKRKKNVLLVYTTDLPVCVQGFWIPVIANVDSHMQIIMLLDQDDCICWVGPNRVMNVGGEGVGVTVAGVTKCDCFMTCGS